MNSRVKRIKAEKRRKAEKNKKLIMFLIALFIVVYSFSYHMTIKNIEETKAKYEDKIDTSELIRKMLEKNNKENK